MENELKTNERMAIIRAEAKEQLGALENAAKVGSGIYVLETSAGFAKVQISAIKAVDYDVEGAVNAYEIEVAEKAAKAEAKAAEKAALVAEKEAKKAAKA